MINWDGLNFIPEEFECRCGCGEIKVEPLLVDTLQEIRTSYGRTMNVTSGYRCVAHPVEMAKINGGGKPGSHSTGKAADIACRGSDALDLLRIALNNPNIRGVGVNQKGPKRFIHLDILEDWPRPNIWSY